MIRTALNVELSLWENNIRLKPWHLFLAGIIIQGVLLVLALYYPKDGLRPGGEEIAIYLIMAFFIITTPMSLLILLYSKLKIPRINSIMLGLVTGVMIVIFAQSIPGVSGTVFLIGGIAIALLFIGAGIMPQSQTK